MNDTAAILQAVKDGDVPVVKRLLTADPRLVRASDGYLKTPLHLSPRSSSPVWRRGKARPFALLGNSPENLRQPAMVTLRVRRSS